jgi:capsular exopolysaccharide synthesis family protein
VSPSTTRSRPDEQAIDTPLIVEKEFPRYVEEVFRSLRTKLLLSLYEESRRQVAVTSLESGAGKTMVSANLALSMAQRNIETLLIDCDLRCGELTTILGPTAEPGLSDFLDSDIPISAQSARSLVHQGVQKHLSFIGAGRQTLNAPELLASPRLRSLMSHLAPGYELVLFDMPPFGMVVDPVVIQDIIAKYILVAKAGSTNIADLSRKVDEYPKIKRKALGIVLNQASLDRKLRYYKYSKYYEGGSKR